MRRIRKFNISTFCRHNITSIKLLFPLHCYHLPALPLPLSLTAPTHLCPFLWAHWTSGVSSAPCASPWSVMATTISNQSLRYNNRSVPAPRQALIKCAARPAPLFIWKIRKVKTPAAAVLWYSDKETSYQHAVDTAHCSPRVPQPVAHTINTRSRDFTSLIGYI